MALEKNSSINSLSKKATDIPEILVLCTPFNREINAAEGGAAEFGAKWQEYQENVQQLKINI